jgi:hypothetical protein
MKKAQGISVNVIIIAAIALLVLVVLSVIYIGRMGSWGTSAADCENKGGTCVPAGQDCPTGYTKYSAWVCTDADPDEDCCIAIQE